MPRKHYHVTVGVSGYMPDSNDYYETRKDAEAGAIWHKQQIRESGFGPLEPENVIITGSASKSGFYVRDNDPHHLPVYIDIEECDHEDCSADD